jgi:hypothetical protein
LSGEAITVSLRLSGFTLERSVMVEGLKPRAALPQ